MGPNDIKLMLGSLSAQEAAQLRNHLLSENVETLGLSPDQALGILQALEDQGLEASRPPGPVPVPLMAPPASFVQDVSQLLSSWQSTFGSAMAAPGQPVRGLATTPRQEGRSSTTMGAMAEMSAIEKKVEELEMHRVNLLMQLQESNKQPYSQPRKGASKWEPAHGSKRMRMTNDEEVFAPRNPGFVGSSLGGGMPPTNQSRGGSQSMRGLSGRGKKGQNSQNRPQAQQKQVLKGSLQAASHHMPGGSGNQSNQGNRARGGGNQASSKNWNQGKVGNQARGGGNQASSKNWNQGKVGNQTAKPAVGAGRGRRAGRRNRNRGRGRDQTRDASQRDGSNFSPGSQPRNRSTSSWSENQGWPDNNAGRDDSQRRDEYRDEWSNQGEPDNYGGRQRRSSSLGRREDSPGRWRSDENESRRDAYDPVFAQDTFEDGYQKDDDGFYQTERQHVREPYSPGRDDFRGSNRDDGDRRRYSPERMLDHNEGYEYSREFEHGVREDDGQDRFRDGGESADVNRRTRQRARRKSNQKLQRDKSRRSGDRKRKRGDDYHEARADDQRDRSWGREESHDIRRRSQGPSEGDRRDRRRSESNDEYRGRSRRDEHGDYPDDRPRDERSWDDREREPEYRHREEEERFRGRSFEQGILPTPPLPGMLEIPRSISPYLRSEPLNSPPLFHQEDLFPLQRQAEDAIGPRFASPPIPRHFSAPLPKSTPPPLMQLPAAAGRPLAVQRNVNQSKRQAVGLQNKSKKILKTAQNITKDLAQMLMQIPQLPPLKKNSLEEKKSEDKGMAAGTAEGKPAAPAASGQEAAKQAKDGATSAKTSATPADAISKAEIARSMRSIKGQAEMLEELELQGFLYGKVMTKWQCLLCFITMRNETSYANHIKSVMHRRKLAKIRSPEGSFERRQLALNLRHKLPSRQSIRPNQLSSRRTERVYFCCVCSTGYSNSWKEHILELQHLRSQRSRCHCKICNLYFIHPKSAKKHLEGHLHKTMTQLRGAEDDKPAGKETAKKIQEPVPSQGKLQKEGEKPLPVSRGSLDIAQFLKVSRLEAKTPAVVRAQSPAMKAPPMKKAPPIAVSKPGHASAKKIAAPEKKEEDPIGLDLVIPVTGFFCKCCSKFYNDKYMAKVNHCKTETHKQKALRWYMYETQDSTKSVKVDGGLEVATSSCPNLKGEAGESQKEENVIIIDDDSGEELQTEEQKLEAGADADADATQEQDTVGGGDGPADSAHEPIPSNNQTKESKSHDGDLICAEGQTEEEVPPNKPAEVKEMLEKGKEIVQPSEQGSLKKRKLSTSPKELEEGELLSDEEFTDDQKCKSEEAETVGETTKNLQDSEVLPTEPMEDDAGHTQGSECHTGPSQQEKELLAEEQEAKQEPSDNQEPSLDKEKSTVNTEKSSPLQEDVPGDELVIDEPPQPAQEEVAAVADSPKGPEQLEDGASDLEEKPKDATPVDDLYGDLDEEIYHKDDSDEYFEVMDDQDVQDKDEEGDEDEDEIMFAIDEDLWEVRSEEGGDAGSFTEEHQGSDLEIQEDTTNDENEEADKSVSADQADHEEVKENSPHFLEARSEEEGDVGSTNEEHRGSDLEMQQDTAQDENEEGDDNLLIDEVDTEEVKENSPNFLEVRSEEEGDIGSTNDEHQGSDLETEDMTKDELEEADYLLSADKVDDEEVQENFWEVRSEEGDGGADTCSTNEELQGSDLEMQEDMTKHGNEEADYNVSADELDNEDVQENKDVEDDGQS